MKFKPVLTAEHARELDRKTIEAYQFSEDTLMELAGLRIATRLESIQENTFLFLAGFGNNGGDALVALRHLALSTKETTLFLYELDPDSTNSNYRLNRDRLDKLIKRNRVHLIKELPEAFTGCIVDALFGSGLSRNLSEPICSVITWVNSQTAYRVSIDVPSGLDSTTGLAKPISIQADLTLTIGYKKTSFFYSDGIRCAGKIEALVIGFDTQLIKPTYFELESDSIDLEKSSSNRTHKYDEGYVSIIAGSEGLSGAAYLSAKAALAAGAAAVKLYYPAGLYPVYDILLPEVLKSPIGNEQDRFFKLKHIDELFEKLHTSSKQIIVLGPGLGKSEESQDFIKTFLSKNIFPIIIDADALAPFSELEENFNFPIICTPHLGELRKMTRKALQSDSERIEQARLLAQKKSIFIFSKGTMGCFIKPNGNSYFLPFTNEKLRKTGYGDVFSGWLARNWLILSNPLDAFFQSSLELFEKAKPYSSDELSPEHLITLETK